MNLKDAFVKIICIVKEKWFKTDTICEHCGNIKVKAKGFNKQNLKYLMWHKPTFDDWFVMLILLMLILGTLAYKRDTQVCRDYALRQEEVWKNFTNGSLIFGTPPPTNYTYPLLNISFARENEKSPT